MTKAALVGAQGRIFSDPGLDFAGGDTPPVSPTSALFSRSGGSGQGSGAEGQGGAARSDDLGGHVIAEPDAKFRRPRVEKGREFGKLVGVQASTIPLGRRDRHHGIHAEG
jgi:hypothetical protein